MFLYFTMKSLNMYAPHYILNVTMPTYIPFILCSQHPAVRDRETKRTFQNYLKFIKEKHLYHVSETILQLVYVDYDYPFNLTCVAHPHLYCIGDLE